MSRLKGITGRSKSSKTVLMASDIHDMSRMAVCSDTPYNSELDQTMKLTGLQKGLNQAWKDVAADVKDKYGKVDLMVYNGEPVDGANKKNLGQQSWTTNLEDGMQDFMKLDSLISRDKVLLVRGSNYHTTVDGTNIEEILADRMGAIRAKPWGGSGYTDAYAMVNVYGKVFNFSHHIGYSKSMAYRSTALAREMANKVRKTFLTDYGLSVTGVAGPGGGTENKPVGLVYIGLSDENKTEVRRFNFSSDRKKNKLKTSQVALDWLRLTLINE